jgi:hypothetical protein
MFSSYKSRVVQCTASFIARPAHRLSILNSTKLLIYFPNMHHEYQLNSRLVVLSMVIDTKLNGDHNHGAR